MEVKISQHGATHFNNCHDVIRCPECDADCDKQDWSFTSNNCIVEPDNSKNYYEFHVRDGVKYACRECGCTYMFKKTNKEMYQELKKEGIMS
jgi:hypothetical protein